MTSKSKAKGNAYERELVDQAKAAGLHAARAWGSDGRSMGLSEGVDLVINDRKLQAKRRAQLPNWLQIPTGCDAVVVREDYGASFVLLPWKDYLELVEGKWS